MYHTLYYSTLYHNKQKSCIRSNKHIIEKGGIIAKDKKGVHPIKISVNGVSTTQNVMPLGILVK